MFRRNVRKVHNFFTTIKYERKFIDSFRFMPISLSNIFHHLSEGLHSDKCTDCKSCLEYMLIKEDQSINLSLF